MTKKFNVNTNPFAKIVFNTELTTEEKKAALVQKLVFNVKEKPAQTERRLQKLEAFMDLLLQERKDMARELIEMTDTDTFSTIHDLFVNLSDSMTVFSDSMQQRESQQRLIDAARDFVNTATKGSETITAQLKNLGVRIEDFDDTNKAVQGIYDLLAEASAEASRLTTEARDTLLASFNQNIAATDKTAADAKKSGADLRRQAANIEIMKTANSEQLAKTSGIASSAINGAAHALGVALIAGDFNNASAPKTAKASTNDNKSAAAKKAARKSQLDL